jgi:hypothetical protein
MAAICAVLYTQNQFLGPPKTLIKTPRVLYYLAGFIAASHHVQQPDKALQNANAVKRQTPDVATPTRPQAPARSHPHPLLLLHKHPPKRHLP